MRRPKTHALTESPKEALSVFITVWKQSLSAFINSNVVNIPAMSQENCPAAKYKILEFEIPKAIGHMPESNRDKETSNKPFKANNEK